MATGVATTTLGKDAAAALGDAVLRAEHLESLSAAASALAAALPVARKAYIGVNELRSSIEGVSRLAEGAESLGRLSESAASGASFSASSISTALTDCPLAATCTREAVERLQRARTAVQESVAELSPPAAVAAAAGGTLKGLSEREAAEDALTALLRKEADAFDALSAAHQARAALADACLVVSREAAQDTGGAAADDTDGENASRTLALAALFHVAAVDSLIPRQAVSKVDASVQVEVKSTTAASSAASPMPRPYSPVTVLEYDSGSLPSRLSSTVIHHISAMQANAHLSAEELRVEHYSTAGRPAAAAKGPQSAPSLPPPWTLRAAEASASTAPPPPGSPMVTAPANPFVFAMATTPPPQPPVPQLGWP